MGMEEGTHNGRLRPARVGLPKKGSSRSKTGATSPLPPGCAALHAHDLILAPAGRDLDGLCENGIRPAWKDRSSTRHKVVGNYDIS